MHITRRGWKGHTIEVSNMLAGFDCTQGQRLGNATGRQPLLYQEQHKLGHRQRMRNPSTQTQWWLMLVPGSYELS